MSFFNSFFIVAEFPKTPSSKPARIPPQTPPAGGKSAEAGRIQNPRQIVSPCLVRISSFNHLDFARNNFELCPTNTAAARSARVPSRKMFLAFRICARQIFFSSKRMRIFFCGSLPSTIRAGGGASDGSQAKSFLLQPSPFFACLPLKSVSRHGCGFINLIVCGIIEALYGF